MTDVGEVVMYPSDVMASNDIKDVLDLDRIEILLEKNSPCDAF